MGRLFRRNGAFVILLAGILGLGTSCGPQPPVRIGFIGPLTGSSSEVGLGGRNCALLKMAEINQAGGLGGRPVELVIRDDQNNRDVALEALKSLEALGIQVVLAHMNSGASDLMVDYANQKGILIFSSIISSSVYEGKDDWFLRGIPTATKFGAFMGEVILEKEGYERPAFLQDKTNTLYAQSILKGLTASLESRKKAVVWNGDTQGSQVDIQGLVSGLAQSRADSLVAVLSPLDTATLMQTLRVKKVTLPLVLSPWSFTPDLVVNGGPASEGTSGVTMLAFGAASPEVEAFKAQYQQVYGGNPAHTAMMAYETLGALALGYQDHPEGTPEGLKNALIQRKSFPGLVGGFTLDAFGDAQRPLYYYKLLGGTYVPQN